MAFVTLPFTRIADKELILYKSQVSYPPVSPWDPNYLTIGTPYTRFAPSFSSFAILDNDIRNTSGNLFDGYFYGITNSGYLRCKFTLDALHSGMTAWGAQYFERDKKLAVFFTKAIGNTVQTVLYMSEPLAQTAGDLGTITLTLVYDDIIAGDFYGDTLTGFNPIVFPGGGLTLGMAFYFTTTAFTTGQPFPDNLPWIYTSFVELPSATKFSIFSNFQEGNTNLRGVTQNCGLNSALKYDSATGYYSFWSQYSFGTGYDIWTPFQPQAAPNSPMTKYIMDGFSIGEFIHIQSGYKTAIANGQISAVGSRTYDITIDFANQVYWYDVLTAGDTATANFLASIPVDSQVIGGYASGANAIIYSHSDAADPLFFTSVKATVGIMGPGPILPILNLACQNFCLPMFRMKKI